jgi:class 3 adenylate cyclase/tetratricopeptide (TPR) repeat protein
MARTTATVLFTDLVQSTALRSQLGDQGAEELRRTHDRVLTEAVEAHGGRVVKGLGDGVMATFAGASDAVNAAVAMQQAIDRLNRSAPVTVQLAIRIGVSAGDVTSEGGDYHGRPVIEASRLCDVAEGGQILASELVKLLAGAGAGLTFDPVGSLELKGLPDPLPTVEVRWERIVLSRVPLPALLTEIGRVFVGREEQLERLEQLWKEVRAGELRLAFLAGEPGVGKTRLAAELAARTHAGGGVVLAGRCDEDLGVPYQPFVEALRHFADHLPPESLPDRLGRYGGELARLVPELAAQLPGLPPQLHSDPETERYRLFDAVAAWLAAVSAEEPLLLVLDDLQWAAKPTLLLLRHVARSSDTKGVLVLGAYRDTELGHDHPLVEVLADLRRQSGVDRISLTGLDLPGVAAWMEHAAGQPLAEEDFVLARAVHQETEGNPFFVREVFRHLVETGAVHREGGRWSARLPVEELGIPEGVREVVGKRLTRLSGGALQVLRTGAVVGAAFEPAVIEVAGDIEGEDLISALEEASDARLVIETGEGRYRFAHSLVRDTVYEGLSALRRVALHRRVAEAIETVHASRLDDHLPALAHHWGRASAPATHATRAALYAARAGSRALAQLAHDEAAHYYRQALELVEVAEEPPVETWRIDLLIGLGEAEHRSGATGYRAVLREAAERAERLGDADRLARAGLAGYRGLWEQSLAVETDRVAVLEAALRARGDREDPMRACLLAVLAAESMFSADRRQRREWSDNALALARRLGDLPTLATVLHSRCAAIWDPAMLEERRANAAELRALTDDLGDPFVKVWASLYSFETAMEAAEVEVADRHLDAAQLSASEVERALWWFSTFPRAGRVLLAGRVEEAETLAREALEIGLATQPLHEARITYGVQRFQIRFEQGRLGELVTKLAEAAADDGYPETRAMLAQTYCELGREDEARVAFEPLAGSLAAIPPDPNWIVTVTRSAGVAAHLGDPAAAAVLYDLLAPYSDRVAGQGIVWTGAVAHYLGILARALGDLAAAEAHLARAADIHQRIGAPIWLARSRVEWAGVLLDRGGPAKAERARSLLGEALTTARALGVDAVERRAVDLLS